MQSSNTSRCCLNLNLNVHHDQDPGPYASYHHGDNNHMSSSSYANENAAPEQYASASTAATGSRGGKPAAVSSPGGVLAHGRHIFI